MFSHQLHALLMNGLKKLFPPAPLSSATPLCMGELGAKYRRLDRVGNFLGFACYLAVAAALYGIFVGIAQFGAHSNEPIQIPAGRTVMRVVLALLLSLLLTIPVMVWVIPLVAGSNRKEYMAYGANKIGFDFRKMGLRLFLPLGLAGLVLLGLATDYYDAFARDGVYTSAYWSLGQEEVRRYRVVEKIIEVDGYEDRFGKFHNAPHFVILFKDGWTMKTPKAASKEKHPPEIWQKLAFNVSLQSGMGIGHKKTYP